MTWWELFVFDFNLRLEILVFTQHVFNEGGSFQRKARVTVGMLTAVLQEILEMVSTAGIHHRAKSRLRPPSLRTTVLSASQRESDTVTLTQNNKVVSS